ncbi:MAG: efflux RND transporter periplasmic adaptor subunit [Betaproteobacteria bacterium]|nr:MAG: efflux RND transporter periplasmic adaptor subunit [Betaproteobacteria bacterium]
MTAITAGLVLAAGAGYWIAQRQHTTPADAPVPQAAAGSDTAAAPAAKRRILYYRNPMGLPDTSPVPKKDSMGMDYVPVYADDKPDDAGVVAVSAARVQTLGVKTAMVESRALEAAVRANGRVEIDERKQVVVAPRFEGWIERLHVNAVGDRVSKGQPLFTTYSPELQSAGEELRIAERLARDSGASDALARESARRLAEATRARLRNLEVAGQTAARQTFHAPADGIVVDKVAVQGARFMPGDALFRIADLSKVWVIADVYEQDLARARVGQSAAITLDAFPGRRFEGKVAYLYPTLNAATRSTPVRLELDNREGLLRPGMFARVDLSVADTTPRTVVPSSAVIDDGKRQVVLLALDEGRFKPQPVRLGQHGADAVEVLEGLRAGDRVVVSANFLIDSESQLKASLSNLTEAEPHAGKAAQGHDPVAAATYRGEGTIDAIDLAANSVTISHGEIPALNWPAMTMDFTLAAPGLAKGIVAGLPARFEFEQRGEGEFVITRIERMSAVQAPATSAHGGH